MALYLYCARAHTTAEPFFCEGIGGSEEVFTITYKDLDAVVSMIPQNAFRGEDIAKKALEDIVWIAEKARKHEAVLAEAMGFGKHRPVIPLKFGTIFRTDDDLVNALALHYDRFLSSLKKLEGKQEWHCKVYLADSKALEKDIRVTNEKVQVKEKEIESMNEGAAYFVQLQIARDMEQEKKRWLEELGENIFQTLKRHAEAATHGKILAKELTGRQDPMIFNGFFLLPDAKIGESQKAVEQLIGKFPILHFAYSGPWPPYNFV